MIGPQRCGGVITTDADGNLIERHACEVHIFGPGNCAWQQKMYDERQQRRADRYPRVNAD